MNNSQKLNGADGFRILAEYLYRDPEVQDFLQYLKSVEFKDFVVQLTATSEYKEALDYLTRVGIHAVKMHNVLNVLLGLPPLPVKANDTDLPITGGMMGLLEDLASAFGQQDGADGKIKEDGAGDKKAKKSSNGNKKKEGVGNKMSSHRSTLIRRPASRRPPIHPLGPGARLKINMANPPVSMRDLLKQIASDCVGWEDELADGRELMKSVVDMDDADGSSDKDDADGSSGSDISSIEDEEDCGSDTMFSLTALGLLAQPFMETLIPKMARFPQVEKLRQKMKIEPLLMDLLSEMQKLDPKVAYVPRTQTLVPCTAFSPHVHFSLEKLLSFFLGTNSEKECLSVKSALDKSSA